MSQVQTIWLKKKKKTEKQRKEPGETPLKNLNFKAWEMVQFMSSK